MTKNTSIAGWQASVQSQLLHGLFRIAAIVKPKMLVLNANVRFGETAAFQCQSPVWAEKVSVTMGGNQTFAAYAKLDFSVGLSRCSAACDTFNCSERRLRVPGSKFDICAAYARRTKWRGHNSMPPCSGCCGNSCRSQHRSSAKFHVTDKPIPSCVQANGCICLVNVETKR